jgi:hypothetical protein
MGGRGLPLSLWLSLSLGDDLIVWFLLISVLRAIDLHLCWMPFTLRGG